MSVQRIPGVGPTNSDVATAVAAAVPNITQITSAVTSNAASAGVTMAAITSSIQTYAASAGLTAAAIVSAGNAAGWASAAPSYPLGATSVVFSGYTSTGIYKYPSNVGAGSYVIDAVAEDSENTRMIVWAPNSNTSTYFKANGAEKGFLRLTTTENPIWFTPFGKLTARGNARVSGQSSPNVNQGKDKMGFRSNVYWMVTSQSAWYSTNSGASWATASYGWSNPYGTYSTQWDGTYYMVGYYQAYMRSTDLVNWSSVDISATNINSINRMLYIGSNPTNKYIFAGSGIFTSTNGTTFTARLTGTGNFNDIQTNNAGTYVAVGGQQSSNPKIYYSTNEATSWTSVTFPANNEWAGTAGEFVNVAYGNGIWVIGGYVLTSGSASYRAITLWSTDAVNWYGGTFWGGFQTTTPVYTDQPQPTNVVWLEFINGIFLLCTNSGSNGGPTKYQFYYSTDGKQFVQVPSELIPVLNNFDGAGLQSITKDMGGSGRVSYFGNWGYSGGSSTRGMVWTQEDAKAAIYMYSIPSQTVLN